jgi:hypothetical protein
MASEKNVVHEGGQLPFKLWCEGVKGDLNRFDIAESKHDNQNALWPTTLKGEISK